MIAVAATVTWAVQATSLSKTYKLGWRCQHLLALSGLDLAVGRGEVFGLLGPNGSGKSTTLKLLLGLCTPTAGTVRIFGEPAGTLASRRRLGFLPENPYFPQFLTGREVLHYYGQLADLHGRKLRERTAELLELVELSTAADRRLRTYSKGMLQRIGLAQALLADPDLLLLDEPTSGVDPVGARQIRDLILTLKQRGKTIVFASHLLAQVQAVADRVAILHQGKKIREGRLAELLSVPEQSWLKLGGMTPAVQDKLAAWLRGEGVELLEVAAPQQSLEDYFIRALDK